MLRFIVGAEYYAVEVSVLVIVIYPVDLIRVVMCPGVTGLDWWKATNASGCNGNTVDFWDWRFSGR
jgi:hypothetical protein